MFKDTLVPEIFSGHYRVMDDLRNNFSYLSYARNSRLTLSMFVTCDLFEGPKLLRDQHSLSARIPTKNLV